MSKIIEKQETLLVQFLIMKSLPLTRNPQILEKISLVGTTTISISPNF